MSDRGRQKRTFEEHRNFEQHREAVLQELIGGLIKISNEYKNNQSDWIEAFSQSDLYLAFREKAKLNIKARLPSATEDEIEILLDEADHIASRLLSKPVSMPEKHYR